MEGLHRGPETPPEAFPISVPGSGRNRAGKQKGNGESEAWRGKGGRAERNGNTGRAERGKRRVDAGNRRRSKVSRGSRGSSTSVRNFEAQVHGSIEPVHDFPRVRGKRASTK